MPTWLIIVLGVYFAVVIGFLIAIYAEAPKHAAEIGAAHYLVAFAWPMWGIWYVYAITAEYFRSRKNGAV